jgi:hypothetical protein
MIANIVKNLQIKHTAILLMLEYKKESRHPIQSSALHRDLAKRWDWLLRRPRSAPLNAFPFCSPQGPLQAQLRKKRQAVSFVSWLIGQN